jgi:hypothetical protein
LTAAAISWWNTNPKMPPMIAMETTAGTHALRALTSAAEADTDCDTFMAMPAHIEN